MCEPTPDALALARDVAAHPNEAMRRGYEAVERLSRMGEDGVAAVLVAMRDPCPEGQHPRDVFEGLAYVLGAIARHTPEPLLAVIAEDAVPPDPMLTFFVFALAEAPREQVMPALLQSARHKNEWVRWAAVDVLARFGTVETRAPITAALRDRSHTVKFAAVEALKRKKRLRTPAAIEPLRRIVASVIIQKHSPGMWEQAKAVLAEIEGRVSDVG